MIYCNLNGGLGNMLFQIAATKSFALDLGVECSFPNLTTHLNILNTEKTHNPKLSHSLEYLTIFKSLRVDPPKTTTKRVQFPFHFIDLTINDDTIIDGFFQSEKYFKHNKSKILKFLNFDVVSKIVNDKYKNILTGDTTSIHVRRGDYVRLINHHPPQSTEYFKESINFIKEKTDKFIIFSDDIDWCKQNIVMDNAIYIDNEKDYIELYMMSLCKNNIISNSSFSWWGAWLNNNPNKKVISPKKWFGPYIRHNTNDIIPETWVKI